MHSVDLTAHWAGLAAVLVFIVAYAGVMAEEWLRLRKSVPVLVAAGLIWLLTGVAFAQLGDAEAAAAAARHNLLEFAELFLFLIVAMTFVNTMEERGVFDTIRAWLVGRGFSLRTLFWVTGGLAFVISPVADNLTTALLMGAVAMAVGQGHPRFVGLACINIVIAANAGGAFSPFGDITTLMVWQKGVVSFGGFFPLVIPSVVNWLVPAALMSLAVERSHPAALADRVILHGGAWTVVLLFIGTIALTVSFHNFLHLPPAVGMMAGLGILKAYSYAINRLHEWRWRRPLVNEMDDVFARSPMLDAVDHAAVEGQAVAEPAPAQSALHAGLREPGAGRPVAALAPAAIHASPPPSWPAGDSGRADGTAAPAAAPDSRRVALPDILHLLEKLEWDTLMFFYGVILCVGGLGALGYLALISRALYEGLGATTANILVGLVSAVVDNVPVMFAVLSMDLELSHGQWLLVTLTAGVGGSLLSIGSAAGVALMGQSRGAYTFLTHLRWSWAIALGYVASIGAHLLINQALF